MSEECRCGENCPMCEGCGLAECECRCDSDIERDDDEVKSEELDW